MLRHQPSHNNGELHLSEIKDRFRLMFGPYTAAISIVVPVKVSGSLGFNFLVDYTPGTQFTIFISIILLLV